MADTLTRTQRSKCMAAIRGKNTKPERIVRFMAHRLGFRFRLHAADLPGTPDLVFRARRAVVFVHGCYWHMHACVRGRSTPATNRHFWQSKRTRNKERDQEVRNALRRAGWRVFIVWECQLRDPFTVAKRLSAFLSILPNDGVRGEPRTKVGENRRVNLRLPIAPTR